MNGPFALTGHMVQNPPHWMAKKAKGKVKLDRLEFLCVRIYYILLPSSTDFVPCDQLVKKAHYVANRSGH